MSGWGCPHEFDGKCQKVLNKPCDMGMKGCVLAGRFRFADPSKNRVRKSSLDEVAANGNQLAEPQEYKS